jgi:predicted ATPase
MRPIYLVMVADELVTRDHLVEAKIPIDAARARIQASQGENWTIPELLRVEAVLASRSGDERTAEKLLLQSLEFADKAGATGWFLRAALSLARLWRDAGRGCEAAAVLAPVVARVVDGVGTKDFDNAETFLRQLPVTSLRPPPVAYRRSGTPHDSTISIIPLTCGDAARETGAVLADARPAL